MPHNIKFSYPSAARMQRQQVKKEEDDDGPPPGWQPIPTPPQPLPSVGNSLRIHPFTHSYTVYFLQLQYNLSHSFFLPTLSIMSSVLCPGQVSCAIFLFSSEIFVS